MVKPARTRKTEFQKGPELVLAGALEGNKKVRGGGSPARAAGHRLPLPDLRPRHHSEAPPSSEAPLALGCSPWPLPAAAGCAGAVRAAGHTPPRYHGGAADYRPCIGHSFPCTSGGAQRGKAAARAPKERGDARARCRCALRATPPINPVGCLQPAPHPAQPAQGRPGVCLAPPSCLGDTNPPALPSRHANLWPCLGWAWRESPRFYDANAHSSGGLQLASQLDGGQADWSAAVTAAASAHE